MREAKYGIPNSAVLSPRPRRRTMRGCLVAALTLPSGGCDPADAPAPAPAPASAESAPIDAPVAARPSPTPANVPGPAATPPDLGGADPEVPREIRRAGRAIMVYPAPRYGAEFRGKIPRGERFWVFESVAGEGDCAGEGWARLGVAAYACLEHAEPATEPPRPLPEVLEGASTPFFYARRRSKEVAPPRWSSRRALRQGAPPLDELEAEHDYAFTVRRYTRGHGKTLSDPSRRTVRERDVEVLEASDFTGRDLQRDPVPAAETLAWAVVWREVPIYDAPRETDDPIDGIEYQQMFYVRDEPRGGTGRNAFYPVSDGRGWVSAKQIRRWVPMEAPAEVEPDQLWVDVDLDQQTLTIHHGETPTFVTLIASGSYKHPTPTGLYRITSKMAYSDMRSRPDDDESYYVEAVPWVMYFDGRYALHGTFWHNRFGRRTSHGCINLSAPDARMLYDLVAPVAPAGWLTVYDHPREPGTLLRIREGTTAPPDRREP